MILSLWYKNQKQLKIMIEKMKEILRKWFGKKKESVNETKYTLMLEATNEKGKQSSMLQ